MKKFLSFILSGLFFFTLLRGIFQRNRENYYDTWTNEITCTDHCLHEIGHKLDDLSGWISRTSEWKEVVSDKDMIIFMNMPISNWLFILTKGDRYTEMYAIYLERYNANFEIMPYKLRPFYNQELLHQIMEEDNIFYLDLEDK